MWDRMLIKKCLLGECCMQRILGSLLFYLKKKTNKHRNTSIEGNINFVLILFKHHLIFLEFVDHPGI